MTKPKPDSKAQINAVIGEINKEYGPETVIWGNQIRFSEIPRISSGSLALDVALGGGWTVNSWHEIYGDESSGKTTVILKTIAAHQATDPNWTVFWIAAEDFVPEFATMMGCDLSRIAVLQTNVLEEGTNAAIRVLETRSVDALVIDSLPALSPITEGEGTMEDQQVGQVARMMGKFFRKAYTAMKRSMVEADRPVTCFMVNQWREKIGLTWGDPRVTPGGRAKNYWYFTRVELKRDEWLVEGEKRNQRKVGLTIKCLVKKNKGFPPERVATFDFYFDHNEVGVTPGSYDPAKELLNLSIFYDVITTKGAYYYYGDESWHGRAALEEQVRWDLTLQKKLRDAVMDVVTKGRRAEAATGSGRRLRRP